MANLHKLDRNPPFVQETKAHMAAKRELMRKNHNAAIVLNYFVQEMDETNAIMVSYGTMTELLDLSKQILIRAIKTLTEDRWVKIIKIGNANSYHVNSTPHFGGAFEDRQYCKFTASVVASASEQTESVEELNVVDLRPLVTGPSLVRLSPDEERHLASVG